MIWDTRFTIVILVADGVVYCALCLLRVSVEVILKNLSEILSTVGYHQFSNRPIAFK